MFSTWCPDLSLSFDDYAPKPRLSYPEYKPKFWTFSWVYSSAAALNDNIFTEYVPNDKYLILSIGQHTSTTHCKDTISKILNKYSQKRNCAGSVLIPHSCVCERFIYSQDWSAFSAAGKYVDRFWKYINRSQTHECWNWDWGRALPFLGIHKWDFRCSASFLAIYIPAKNHSAYTLYK